ncbi:hypothetical protein K502DRAFT_54441 [Neoconidiobolus thromboides FSU 785]|nr:hypothetical protein K502DRAFT_54441 [Neoconidiobolus thromboides FSU 785]
MQNTTTNSEETNGLINNANSINDRYTNSNTNKKISSSFSLAAKSVTDLYREAHQQQKIAYKKGYEQCLRDMVNFVNEQLRLQNETSTRGFDTPFIALNQLESFTSERLTQIYNETNNNQNDEEGFME